jgi:cardiolipin synthase
VELAWLRRFSWYAMHQVFERSHARVVVVDGRVGYTGGFGLADYWLGAGRKPEEWRETNVRFEGPAVAQLQAAFATTWAEATGELLTGAAFYPDAAFDPVTADSVSPVGVRYLPKRTGPGSGAAALDAPPDDAPTVARAAAAGTARAGLFHAVPSQGSTPAERLYALTIAGARRRLYITNAYFVPDDDFRGLLMRAARRGVDVRILTTGPETDVQTTRWAGRWRYAELLAAGGAHLGVPAGQHARQDDQRRRRVGHRRLDELRQPLARLQRRDDAAHPRPAGGGRDGRDVPRRPALLQGDHARRDGRPPACGRRRAMRR